MAFSSLTTASRFSVLKLEDDDDKPKKMRSQPKNPAVLADKKKTHPSGKKQSKEPKNVEVSDVNELRSLAFGVKAKKQPVAVTKPNAEKEKARPPKASSHTQASKKKTAEVPNINDLETKAFEEELQEAILLSKMDYEEKREFYETSAQETEDAKASAKHKKRPKKENVAMSLGEFNSVTALKSKEMVNGHTLTNGVSGKKEKKQQSPPIGDFFEEVNKDVKKELQRENQKQAKKAKELQVPTDVRILELQDALEKVTNQKEWLEGELSNLKKMNVKLCSLLSEGKSSNNADILRRAEENNSVKDELTQEIATLHVALEQERSKNHGLQEKLLKYQGHRKDSK